MRGRGYKKKTRLIFYLIDIAGYDFLTAVVIKGSIFWPITLCSLLKVKQRFGGTHRLHL
jgi:hypothetical protein